MQPRLFRHGQNVPDRLRPPSPGQVHLWVLGTKGLACGERAAFYALLSPEERRRCDRFRFAADRERHALARGLARRLLGRYCEADPRELRFRYGPWGKPELAGRSAVSFNLSHSGDHILAGFAAPGDSLGVDIEPLRPLDGLDGLLACLHSRERQELFRLDGPARAAAFLRLWTCKEAVVKALGQGLSLPLDSFVLGLSRRGEPVPRRLPPGPAAWWLRRFDLRPGLSCAAALACGFFQPGPVQEHLWPNRDSASAQTGLHISLERI